MPAIQDVFLMAHGLTAFYYIFLEVYLFRKQHSKNRGHWKYKLSGSSSISKLHWLWKCTTVCVLEDFPHKISCSFKHRKWKSFQKTMSQLCNYQPINQSVIAAKPAIYLQEQKSHFISWNLKAIPRQKLFTWWTRGNGSNFIECSVEDFCVHSIRACLKAFHSTHQDKLGKGGTSPEVTSLTVKYPTPLCYLEASVFLCRVYLSWTSL